MAGTIPRHDYILALSKKIDNENQMQEVMQLYFGRMRLVRAAFWMCLFQCDCYPISMPIADSISVSLAISLTIISDFNVNFKSNMYSNQLKQHSNFDFHSNSISIALLPCLPSKDKMIIPKESKFWNDKQIHWDDHPVVIHLLASLMLRLRQIHCIFFVSTLRCRKSDSKLSEKSKKRLLGKLVVHERAESGCAAVFDCHTSLLRISRLFLRMWRKLKLQSQSAQHLSQSMAIEEFSSLKTFVHVGDCFLLILLLRP